MLNNLAASFQSSTIRRKEEIDVQSRKRQKTDVYPAYLLNFCCPRSSYDLHFEPTKTIVEFKDWQTVLFFFEQAISNYWKKHALQTPKAEASSDVTHVPVQNDVKLNQDRLEHHNVQNKKYYADFKSTQQENAVGDSRVDMCATAALKDPQCFAFDMEPSIQHVPFSGRVTNAFQNDNIASIDYKLGFKQMHSPENGSSWWSEDDPSQLGDDLSSVNPTSWKRGRREYIFHEDAYSGHFGMSEDVPTEGFLAHEQESDLLGPEIEMQEPCFTILNEPNRMTCDFVQSQANMKPYTSGCDGFDVELDNLNEDRLVNEASEITTDIVYPEMSHFSDGFYRDDGSIFRGFCTALRKCSTSCLGTAARCVEPVVDTVGQINFPDTLAVWNNDFLERSPTKDPFGHFIQPFSLADTPCSRARTDLKLHRRSIKTFGFWNCENIDSDFRYTLDRFTSASPIVCEGTKHLDNFVNEAQPLNCFSNDFCSTKQSGSDNDLLTRKSKFDARLLDDTSPEERVLNVLCSQMTNDAMLTRALLNQHNFECDKRSRPSDGRRSRRKSAPPFYRCRQKFSRLNQNFSILNEPLREKATNGDKDACTNKPEDNVSVPKDISHMSSTQPIPETDSSEFSGLNFSSNGYEKMGEDACSDGLEDSTVQITKWRNDSSQHTAMEFPHGLFGCYDDVLSISSGVLHLSYSSLVPEFIDKNCFEEVRVLLQVDKKFIPVISGETILLVDQHAADERIRLEELRCKVLSEEGRGITYLDSEEELSLPEIGFQLFQKYAEQIRKWGWITSSCSNSSESFKKNMNILSRQARLVTLVAVPCILGVNLTGKDLMEFIEQLDETDGSSAIPPAVLRILNFKACRGAIMFGDPLLPSECSLVIGGLKATSLCFQCAHGRPTTVPIVNVASLHSELARLEMLSGRRAGTWHGLAHRGPSLERARTRLERLSKCSGRTNDIGDVENGVRFCKH